MDLLEIKTAQDTLIATFEAFKSANDERLKQLEKKSADVVTIDKVEKINTAIDEQKEKIEKLHAAFNRPGVGGDNNGGEKASVEVLEHKAAFVKFLRKGNENGLQELEQKALSVRSDPDGGYLVTPAMSSEIVKIVYETSPIRPYASVETISTDSLDIMDDRGEIGSGWVAEAGTVSETTTPQFGVRNIPTHEMYAEPRATQKLLDDSSIDIESWLAQKNAEHFSRKENTAFFTGNGVGKPRGILTYSAGTSWGTVEQVASGSSADFDADDLIALMYQLKQGYAQNSTWFMNRLTVKKARLLKENTTQQYIWTPGLQVGAPDTLLGRPVVMAADMPVPAADSLSIAFGDFKQAYQIVDRLGIRTLRDPFTLKGFIKFYSTKRVGGDVKNFEAFKLLKLGS